MKPAQLYTDGELLNQLRFNDQAAFQLLYERYWKPLYSAAFKRLPDHDSVKDILQDIFLNLWQRRGELRIDDLPSYLLVAVKNRVLKKIERENRYTSVETLLHELGYSSSHADALLVRDELQKAYEAIIARLTPSQQKIIRLRFEQDLGTEEIAEQMEISRKTVQNQLRTALIHIRSLLATLLVSTILKNFF